MFGICQIYLNETKLHISGGIIVAISIICRTNDIYTGICHASVQVVDILQLRTSENEENFCFFLIQIKVQETKRNQNLPNCCLAIAPQRYCNASI